MLSLPIPLRKLALATTILLVPVNDVVSASDEPLIEVFTASTHPIIPDHQGNGIQIYDIDGIKRFEVELSLGLPADTDAARRQAIERVAQVGEERAQRVQRSAMGLSKAMQYGIDRYPAVVFNREAVVYGATDLAKVRQRYQLWREASGQ